MSVGRHSPLLMGLLMLAVLAGSTAALRCFVCNSISEPECGQSPPPESLAADCAVGRQSGGSFIPAVPDALVCWSQRQDAKGTKAVVRHCGGLASTKNGASTEPECYERVGSNKVRSRYCKCTGDLCNAAGLGPVATGGFLLAVGCALQLFAFY